MLSRFDLYVTCSVLKNIDLAEIQVREREKKEGGREFIHVIVHHFGAWDKFLLLNVSICVRLRPVAYLSWLIMVYIIIFL